MSAPAPGGKAGALLPAIGGGGTREFATGCVSLGSGRIRSAGGTQDPPCSSLTALLPGAVPHASCWLLLGHVPMVSYVLMCECTQTPVGRTGWGGCGVGHPAAGEAPSTVPSWEAAAAPAQDSVWAVAGSSAPLGTPESGQDTRSFSVRSKQRKKAHPSKARSATPRSRQITTHISF